jgi:hypothetical protein
MKTLKTKKTTEGKSGKNNTFDKNELRAHFKGFVSKQIIYMYGTNKTTTGQLLLKCYSKNN